MAYASTATASPAIRIPSVAMPKFRWPQLSQRTRALLMMAIMASPCFLSDTIGYYVQRLYYTPEQIAAKRSPGNMLKGVNIFHVACPADNTPAEQARWTAYAREHGLPLYPEGGPGCFNPNRNMLGVLGLKAFNVACPTMLLSATDLRKWVAYTASHSWTAYPQAGEGCVDP
jgi:hypothetical protein